MADEFKPGDVVMLKSGGPPMTVRSVAAGDGGAAVTCSWFVGTKIHQQAFAAEMLRNPPPRRAIPISFR